MVLAFVHQKVPVFSKNRCVYSMIVAGVSYVEVIDLGCPAVNATVFLTPLYRILIMKIRIFWLREEAGRRNFVFKQQDREQTAGQDCIVEKERPGEAAAEQKEWQ